MNNLNALHGNALDRRAKEVDQPTWKDVVDGRHKTGVYYRDSPSSIAPAQAKDGEPTPEADPQEAAKVSYTDAWQKASNGVDGWTFCEYTGEPVHTG